MNIQRVSLVCALGAAVSFGGSSGCDCGAAPDDVVIELGDGFVSAAALDEHSVIVRFADDIAAGSADGAFAINDFTSAPPASFAPSADVSGKNVTLTTDEALQPGVRYTVVVDGLKTTAGRTLSGTLNFTAIGVADTATIRVVIADVETARLHDGLTLLATVNPDGTFSEELQTYPISDVGSAFEATLTVGIDAARSLDPADDADVSQDRRPYALLVMDSAGRTASALVPFVVTGDGEVDVDIVPPLEIETPPDQDPLPLPPDDVAGDGLRQVRVVVDDRASKELVAPQLKVSFNAAGEFDASFPQTLTLEPMTGDDAGYWQAVVGVKVDAARVVDGTSPDTFPYFAFLVNDGAPIEALSVSLVAPDETPQTVRLSLGNPEWTPVTFRVDVSKAYLNASGSERGVRAGEAVFITGEWQQGVDALGNNCGDAFSGGEQPCLKMKESPTVPGVWTRTVWLPPGRPYGWKVVRCDGTDGCGPLNRLVASSGRAFATVMKNLVTDNVDAFADANCGLVDVINPAATVAGTQTLNYTTATVFQGSGNGGEPDPAGTPDGQRMFKQEVPDLVVVVAQQAIRTRVMHIGTWRDVNLGLTPQEILDTQASVDLGATDYDDGFTGRFPPSREEP